LTGQKRVIAADNTKAENNTLNELGHEIEESLSIISGKANVQFSLGNYSVMENGGKIDITVFREGDKETECTVEYETKEGTAKEAKEYEATKGTLTFQKGETEKTFAVKIIDNDEHNENKEFHVSLSNPTNAVLGTRKSASVEIIDDDVFNVLGFKETVYECDEKSGTIILEVERFNNLKDTITVDYHTEDDTAIKGVAYKETKGTLTFGPEENSRVITVPILQDNASKGEFSSLKVILDNVSEKGVLSTKCKTCSIKIFEDELGKKNPSNFTSSHITKNPSIFSPNH